MRSRAVLFAWFGLALGQAACGDRPPPRNHAPPPPPTNSSGVGDAPPHSAEPPANALRVRDLTMGDGFTCAFLDAGVKCWGYNAGGELGLIDTQHRGGKSGDMGDALPFVQLKGGVVQRIVAGGSSVCALGVDGTVTCWGGDYKKKTRVPMPSSKIAVGVASGGNGQCAVLYDESVVCWRAGAPHPELVDVGASVRSVHVGGDHTCAVLVDGGLKCWGANGSGELGMGSEASHRRSDSSEMGKALPRVDLGSRSVKTMALGAGFSCALLDNGQVKCWGGNGYGRLGRKAFGENGGTLGAKAGQMGNALAAIDFAPDARAAAIAVGSNHGCALLAQGDVMCWGRGFGEGTPMTVDLGQGVRARALVAGWDTTCALDLNGRVKCWGRNDAGQLGLGDTRDRGAPADWGDALPFVDLGIEAVAPAKKNREK